MTSNRQENSPNDNVPRTIVEFLDYKQYDSDKDNPLCHKAARVLINGTEVLVRKDSIAMAFGEPEETTVTLTLLPTEVHFHHRRPDQPTT